MHEEELKSWFESELTDMPFEPIFGMVLFSDGCLFGHGKIGSLEHLSVIDKYDLAMQLRKLADGLDNDNGSEKFFAEQKKLDDMIKQIKL